MKRFQKSRFSRVLNVLLTVLLVISAGFLIFVTSCTVRGEPVILFGKCVMQIITGSMEPVLHVGDCVIVEQIRPEELSAGDVIAYVSQSGDIAGLTVMHRITECLPDGRFLTKGDANPVPDALTVAPEQIQGRFLRKSRFFTWLTSFANLRKILLLIVMCMTTLMALYEVRTISEVTREIRNETKEERRERLMREAIDREKQRLAEEHYQSGQEEHK